MPSSKTGFSAPSRHIPDGERVSLRVESRYVVDDDLSDVADLLDDEFMEECRLRVANRDVPTLAEVQRILSKFKGSLADRISEERGGR